MNYREQLELEKRRIRTPAANHYDRNCVLSSVAGQLIAAQHLGVPVKCVVVGDGPFGVGVIAHEIKLADMSSASNVALIGLAGVVAFLKASGSPLEPNEQLAPFSAMLRAEEILTPSIEDGSFVRVVRCLDALKQRGERKI